MTDTRRPTSRPSAPIDGGPRSSVQPSTAAGLASGRGFQPARRRRNRIALGVLLIAVAVGVNAIVYANLNRATPVVQVVRDVPAGAQLTTDMLRTVDVDADPSVNVIPGDDLATIAGQYAKVRLVAGSLVPPEALQDDPLVSEESAVLAIQVAEGSLPIGLRERVPIVLVVPPRNDGEGPTSIDGRVVGLPQATSDALGLQSLSVEVARDDAATLAASDDVRVVLVEPTIDPASDPVGDDPADPANDAERDPGPNATEGSDD